jgi:hypothetical protein
MMLQPSNGAGIVTLAGAQRGEGILASLIRRPKAGGYLKLPHAIDVWLL